ncbi:MAG: hypothetical protein R6X19_03835 [Kiritimatiellia bacterium]
MAKLRIDRKASDNACLHKDFHGALSTGLEYLRTQFGESAVRAYRRQFAVAWYAPFHKTPDERFIEVTLNPAVSHMRSQTHVFSPMFRETAGTVGTAICENTPYEAELIRYDDESGRYTQRFFRRPR